ncbi:hypothetical protein [Halorubrum sp. DTA98]|uniref:hypothetical protein n=1 Tax=Halorubrum sp. DTA98 TaxID=3402163 RepID=UPI003AAB2ED8
MGTVRKFVRTWIVGRMLLRNPVAFVAIWLVNRLRRGHRTASEVPLSTLRARGRVGADFLDRRGLVDENAPQPTGEIDDLDAFARSNAEPSDRGSDGSDGSDGAGDGFDPAAVDDRVREFCEHTAAYRLVYRVRWGRGFRLGARLASRLTSRIEQLNLPGTDVGWRRLHSRFVAVDLPDDTRDGVRGWVRTADCGDCVFLALYGTYEHDPDEVDRGERFVNVAVPLPGCTLSTVLRPRNVARPDRGPFGRLAKRFGRGVGSEDVTGGGIEWTTAGGGHPGLYLRFPWVAFRLPVSQRFRVLPAGPDDSGQLHATHEMWLFGIRFLRIDYRMER